MFTCFITLIIFLYILKVMIALFVHQGAKFQATHSIIHPMLHSAQKYFIFIVICPVYCMNFHSSETTCLCVVKQLTYLCVNLFFLIIAGTSYTHCPAQEVTLALNSSSNADLTMNSVRSKLSSFKYRCWPHVTFQRFLLGLIVGTVLYNEFLCYWIATWWWTSIHSPNPNHLRLLFVADPQLVGFNDDAILRPVSRLDCDRYVAKTFSYALNHVRPDVIIYMGDLLDEGSTATDEEFQTYVTRFNQVFQTYRDIPRIVIPGDNDVGGEGFDRKTVNKIKRFNQYFVPGSEQGKNTTNSIVQAKFLDFMTLNLDEHDRVIDDNYISGLAKLTKPKKGKFNVILNHFEMIERFEITPLVKEFNTNVMFTAHRHKARIYTCQDCRKPNDLTAPERWRRNWQGSVTDIKDSEVYAIDISSTTSISEIAIPTCSYRMGVPQMGYGSATLGSDGQLLYTVLWLPSRYKYLASYIAMLVVLAILMFGRCLSLVLCQQKQQSFSRPTLLPLYS